MASSFTVHVAADQARPGQKKSIVKVLGLKTALTVAGNNHLRVIKISRIY
jgi:putative NIF3 family GTP cyclohydrolase 1 type 2